MMRGAAREQDKVAYAWLFAQSKAQHGRIVALSVLCALQAAVLVGFALACRAVIDQAVAGNAAGLLASAAALAGVIVSQLVLRLAINGTQERIRARFALELRKSMLDSIFAARYGNVLRFHSGELSNRMFSDVQVVSNGVSTIIPSFVSMIAQLVFAIAVLALISPPMVALFAGAALLSFVLARTLRGRLKALHRAVQEKEGAVRVFLQEALEHQLVIRSFGAQPATSAHADALQEEHFGAQMRRRGWSIAANASFAFFFNALYAVALTWCAFELLHGTMSYGTLMAVLQLIARIQAPVSSLSGMLPQLYQTLASAERLMEVAELPHSEDRLPLTAAEFYQRLSGVRICDLAFSYRDEEGGGEVASADASGCDAGDGEVAVVLSDAADDVLAGQAAESEGGAGEKAPPASSEDEVASLFCEGAFVPKGSFVVVEGPSGSGKSTLFKLVLGAYDADGFAYELADDAAGAAVASCSASQVPPGVFAYVPQDNFLFAGSVRENVAFAAPDATDVQVKRACETACAWGFVEELPQGLDTMIGEHGQGLSQGQLQRLAIARAVCSGAPIMVLDEVTSALDDATEAAVLANIAALPGKTVFVAAHRAKAREFATMRLRAENGVLREVR
ncbi:ABC transporter ATP-binding protein [uncultured Senegalimassilia sp.]|uniref:ABC transporter ATP-binding protein n=1 Tax=uncultured Senegalimassilia sp. TaxID=1714350 RepID=UPI0025E8D405|nr:ABC transporter ATP-binding protein [uncultured Senegalimassilia sp.]